MSGDESVGTATRPGRPAAPVVAASATAHPPLAPEQPAAVAHGLPRRRWFLPSAVIAELDPEAGRRLRRTVRDWAVDP